MAITNFTPEIWSARLHHLLYQYTPWLQATNTEYEADLSGSGNKVKIFTIEDNITIQNYTRNSDIADPELANTSMLELTLDQEKYFNFAVDDVDAVQARANVIDQVASNTARKAGRTIDSYAAGLMTGEADKNFGNLTAASVDQDFALSITSDAKRFFAEIALPVSMIVCVTTPKVFQQLDEGMTDGTYRDPGLERVFSAQGAGDDPSDQMGYVGRYNGIPWYVSNDSSLVGSEVNTNGTDATAGKHKPHDMYFFDRRDFALVTQINKVEAYRPEKRFADAVKGLYVYGGKVLTPARMYKTTIREETAAPTG